MQTTIYFDLETGGLDVERSPIIQIAAIAVRGREIVGEYARKLLFDESAADPKALELNSYNAGLWAAVAEKPAVVMASFSAFLKQHATVEMVSQRTGNPYMVAQLAGHNAARFDGPMLQAWYRKAGEFLPASFHVLDTLQLAMWYFRRSSARRPANLKLETLAEHFGIQALDAHDALADVKTTFSVASLMESRIC